MRTQLSVKPNIKDISKIENNLTNFCFQKYTYISLKLYLCSNAMGKFGIYCAS